MDKISKKILKYMNSAKPDPADKFYDWDEDMSAMSNSLNIPKETLRAAIRHLHEKSYIRYCLSQSGTPIWFQLDYAGLTYKHQNRSHRNEWLLDHLWIPLLVSFLSGVGADNLIRILIDRLFT